MQDIRFVVGAPYRAAGIWRYPRARFNYDETGLATTIASPGPFLTDGAVYDPTALVGAHRTLQLPCVAQISNLESGLLLDVRIEHRGPEQPGRLVALSPRAMALLGFATTPGAPRVRVRMLEAESRALAATLGAVDAPVLQVTAAPATAVTAESLAPPRGAKAAASRVASGPSRAVAASEGPRPVVPPRLPEIVTQQAPRPGLLFVLLGAFSRPEYAHLFAARLAALGAKVSATAGAAPDRAFRVRIGPLPAVVEADAALDRALREGVVDAEIVIDEG